jgi:hypothetical protein
VPSGSAEACVQRVAAVTLPGRLLSTLAPLLAIMRHLNAQLAYSDQAIEHLAAHDARVQRLRTVPSIGPVTATAFVATLDDVQRVRPPTRSRRTSASCRASAARGRPSAAATSPRPAPPACGGCGFKPRSPCSGAGRRRRTPSACGRCPWRPDGASMSPSSRSLAAWPASSLRSSATAPPSILDTADPERWRPRCPPEPRGLIVRTPVSRRFDGWVSASVALAALKGRRIDGAPHPSNPLVRRRALTRSPLMGANRRLTEPRETGGDACAMNSDKNKASRDMRS